MSTDENHPKPTASEPSGPVQSLSRLLSQLSASHDGHTASIDVMNARYAEIRLSVVDLTAMVQRSVDASERSSAKATKVKRALERLTEILEKNQAISAFNAQLASMVAAAASAGRLDL